jgi:hypothetical protein
MGKRGTETHDFTVELLMSVACLRLAGDLQGIAFCGQRNPGTYVKAGSTLLALKDYSEISMKSMFKIAGALLLLVSGAAFAADQTATPATSTTTTQNTATVPATSTTTTTTGKMTREQYKAAKKQIEADEKMAKAACEKLKGAEESACKKDAEAKEKTAMAELKAHK